MTLPIAPTDVVLDVGSGGKPHPRANVLCERFVRSTRDRCGLGFDAQGKDVVIGDIGALPFVDHAFDFVICSHVLEHLEDPESGIRELQRVAKAGYIETPSELAEVLTDNPAHENIVRVEGQTLIVFKKKPYDHSPRIKPLVRGLHRRRDWHRVMSYDELFVRYLWRDRIDFRWESHGDDGEARDHHGDVSYDGVMAQEPSVSRFLRRVVLKRITALVYPDRTRYQVRDLLGCPICHHGLEFEGEIIRCGRCGTDYGYEQENVPRLLTSDRVI